MRQDQAKPLICNSFRRWLERHPEVEKPTGTDELLFYSGLQKSGVGALNFRCRGDKWQHVHSWLRSEGLCADEWEYRMRDEYRPGRGLMRLTLNQRDAFLLEGWRAAAISFLVC